MGYGMQSNGGEGGQSGSNSSDDEMAGHEWCCNKWHKKGRDLNRHNTSIHNHRFPCVFYETCGEVSADNKALNRHYWVHHKRYARENKIPSSEGECEACGKKFGRKDRINRHLKRFPACREKLGL
ncbi:hypothetical protein CEP51_006827 [Fusarium floridanum]|uniref:C2H2-type domain-containing protein n=1 Tax=Fusarium floridanum TaxID=1325733 RepID=A0A428RRT1_9HYPO|nr:hypothetical protein CEP51_006827 [Fusarium floridanum]